MHSRLSKLAVFVDRFLFALYFFEVGAAAGLPDRYTVGCLKSFPVGEAVGTPVGIAAGSLTAGVF